MTLLNIYFEKIKLENGNIAQVESIKLIGMEKLWQLCLHSSLDCASEFLINILRHIKREQIEKEGGEIRKTFLDKCLGQIQNTFPLGMAIAKHDIIRGIDLISKYISSLEPESSGSAKQIQTRVYPSTYIINCHISKGLLFQSLAIQVPSSYTWEQLFVVFKTFSRIQISQFILFGCNQILQPDSTPIRELLGNSFPDIYFFPKVTIEGKDTCEELLQLKELVQGKKDTVYISALCKARGLLENAIDFLLDEQLLEGLEREAIEIERNQYSKAFGTGLDTMKEMIVGRFPVFSILYDCLKSGDRDVEEKAYTLLLRLDIPDFLKNNI